jgi:L-seryl-tRNA(Ser) seleniumtransferase
LHEISPLTVAHGVPLVADLGSGLLSPDPFLPEEPDAATALVCGADVVIASGDKLLGGPQAGLLLGRKEIITRLARHPLARAVRADKLALAALEATLAGGPPPVVRALHADAGHLQRRTDRLARELDVPVVSHDGRVGGGGAPGVPLPGWALRLPEGLAGLLRTGDPAVLPRVNDGSCLIDLRCIAPADDDRILDAIRKALAAFKAADAGGVG